MKKIRNSTLEIRIRNIAVAVMVFAIFMIAGYPYIRALFKTEKTGSSTATVKRFDLEVESEMDSVEIDFKETGSMYTGSGNYISGDLGEYIFSVKSKAEVDMSYDIKVVTTSPLPSGYYLKLSVSNLDKNDFYRAVSCDGVKNEYLFEDVGWIEGNTEGKRTHMLTVYASSTAISNGDEYDGDITVEVIAEQDFGTDEQD